MICWGNRQTVRGTQPIFWGTDKQFVEPNHFFGKQQIGSEKLTSGNPTKKQWRKCKSVVDRCCLWPPLFRNLRWEDQRKTCCLPWDNRGPTCWDTRILGYWSRSPRGWPQVVGIGWEPDQTKSYGTTMNLQQTCCSWRFEQFSLIGNELCFCKLGVQTQVARQGSVVCVKSHFHFWFWGRLYSTQVGTSDIRMGANPFQSGSGVEGSINIWRRMSRRWLPLVLVVHLETRDIIHSNT
jgi:hypothetical protein